MFGAETASHILTTLSPFPVESPTPITWGPGLNVTVHSTNRSMGGAVTYPGVITALFDGRARVQFWRWSDVGWETAAFDLDLLTVEDHDIGYCLDCGKYDWYANLSARDCRCNACETAGLEDFEALAEVVTDDARTFWADWNEDDWKV